MKPLGPNNLEQQGRRATVSVNLLTSGIILVVLTIVMVEALFFDRGSTSPVNLAIVGAVWLLCLVRFIYNWRRDRAG